MVDVLVICAVIALFVLLAHIKFRSREHITAQIEQQIRKTGKVPRSVFVMLVLMGGVMAWSLGEGYVKGEASKQWPTVQATITRSETQPRRRLREEVIIEYQYAVNGKGYVGDTVSFESSRMSRHIARALSEQFPVQQERPVFYNPQQPQESVLIPGSSRWNLLWIGVGVLLVAEGILGLLGLMPGSKMKIT